MSISWTSEKLGKLVTINYGKSPNGIRQDDGDYPIIGTGGITGWSNQFLCDQPSIVLGRKGTITSPQLITSPFWPIDTTFYCLPQSNVDVRWMYYTLTFERLEQYNQSTGLPSLSREVLHEIPITLPPLPEQRKIAEILGTWDEAIRLTADLIAAKQQRKKGLMQRLLSGEVRFPGFAGRQFKEVKLGDVFTERSDKGNDHLPLLSITRERGIVLRDEIDRRDTSNSDKSSYLLIREGDIGYNTMRMWQGVSAVSSLEGIVSPAYTVCVPNISKIVPSFMGYLFKLPSIINLFWRYSQGLVNDTLSLKYHNFAKIIVKLPSLDEQKKISKVLELCDEEINLLEQKHAALQQQKKGLMQRLLTGQVRVRG